MDWQEQQKLRDELNSKASNSSVGCSFFLVFVILAFAFGAPKGWHGKRISNLEEFEARITALEQKLEQCQCGEVER